MRTVGGVRPTEILGSYADPPHKAQMWKGMVAQRSHFDTFSIQMFNSIQFDDSLTLSCHSCVTVGHKQMCHSQTKLPYLHRKGAIWQNMDFILEH